MLKKVFLLIIPIFSILFYGCASMRGSTIIASIMPGIESPLYVPKNVEDNSSNIKIPANYKYNTRITPRGEILVLPKPVRFALGKYGIGSYYNDSIAYVVNYMQKYPNIRIIVEGHTDKTGKYKNNKTLSIRRSKSGTTKLVNAGIARARLLESGMGARFSGYKLNSQNRRIEFIIIKNNSDLKKYGRKVR